AVIQSERSKRAFLIAYLGFGDTVLCFQFHLTEIPAAGYEVAGVFCIAARGHIFGLLNQCTQLKITEFCCTHSPDNVGADNAVEAAARQLISVISDCAEESTVVSNQRYRNGFGQAIIRLAVEIHISAFRRDKRNIGGKQLTEFRG